MKTSGFKEYRLKKDDHYYAKEIKALEVFNENYLKYADSIIFGQKDGESIMTPNDYLTEREEKVVLSLIQWLGTPVGQGFIRDLNKKDNLSPGDLKRLIDNYINGKSN